MSVHGARHCFDFDLCTQKKEEHWQGEKIINNNNNNSCENNCNKI